MRHFSKWPGLLSFQTARSRLVCEWGGSITGCLGAMLLATNTNASPFGWVAFIISNLFMIRFAIAIRSMGMLCMQLVFTGTSILGICQWLL